MHKTILLALALAVACTLSAADEKEVAVGLVLNGANGKVLRANTETPLAARPGDLLFSGDGLRTDTLPASFLFCPTKNIDTLGPAGEVRLRSEEHTSEL